MKRLKTCKKNSKPHCRFSLSTWWFWRYTVLSR